MKVRDGRATVSGDETCTMPLACSWEGAGSRESHKSGDLPLRDGRPKNHRFLGVFFFEFYRKGGRSMKVHEYLAKDILRSEGIRVPRSVLVTEENLSTEKDLIIESIEKLGFPQVLKSQVLVGGRMKAGGVKIVDNIEGFFKEIERMLITEIKGEKPYGVLVEEFIPHESERYLSISIDRNLRDITFVYSDVGGIDIEEYSRKHPDRVIKTHELSELPMELQGFVSRLNDIFVRYDLTLLEINPFVVRGGEYYALDAVFHVDDSALFRQLWADEEETGSHFVELEDGNVGVIGCGAGIVMATLDALVEYGFKPANFYDIGGGATAEVVYDALGRVYKITNKVVLNIFGGITDCVEIANGIIRFKNDNPDIDIFLRLSGNNEIIARELLKNHGVCVVNDMKELIESFKKGGIKDVFKV